MTRLTILSAAAVLSMMAATPVFADAFAQQEPSAFAATHPNASILSARATVPFGKSAYAARAQMRPHVKSSRR